MGVELRAAAIGEQTLRRVRILSCSAHPLRSSTEQVALAERLALGARPARVACKMKLSFVHHRVGLCLWSVAGPPCIATATRSRNSYRAIILLVVRLKRQARILR